MRLPSWLFIGLLVGPWASLGVHVHPWPPSKSHVDLHLLWLFVCIGPDAKVYKEDGNPHVKGFGEAE